MKTFHMTFPVLMHIDINILDCQAIHIVIYIPSSADKEHSQDEEENPRPDCSCSGGLPMVDLHRQKLQGKNLNSFLLHKKTTLQANRTDYDN